MSEDFRDDDYNEDQDKFNYWGEEAEYDGEKVWIKGEDHRRGVEYYQIEDAYGDKHEVPKDHVKRFVAESEKVEEPAQPAAKIEIPPSETAEEIGGVAVDAEVAEPPEIINESSEPVEPEESAAGGAPDDFKFKIGDHITFVDPASGQVEKLEIIEARKGRGSGKNLYVLKDSTGKIWGRRDESALEKMIAEEESQPTNSGEETKEDEEAALEESGFKYEVRQTLRIYNNHTKDFEEWQVVQRLPGKEEPKYVLADPSGSAPNQLFMESTLEKWQDQETQDTQEDGEPEDDFKFREKEKLALNTGPGSSQVIWEIFKREERDRVKIYYIRSEDGETGTIREDILEAMLYQAPNLNDEPEAQKTPEENEDKNGTEEERPSDRPPTYHEKFKFKYDIREVVKFTYQEMSVRWEILAKLNERGENFYVLYSLERVHGKKRELKLSEKELVNRISGAPGSEPLDKEMLKTEAKENEQERQQKEKKREIRQKIDELEAKKAVQSLWEKAIQNINDRWDAVGKNEGLTEEEIKRKKRIIGIAAAAGQIAIIASVVGLGVEVLGVAAGFSILRGHHTFVQAKRKWWQNKQKRLEIDLNKIDKHREEMEAANRT